MSVDESDGQMEETLSCIEEELNSSEEQEFDSQDEDEFDSEDQEMLYSEDDHSDAESMTDPFAAPLKPLTDAEIKKYQDRIDKSGVVYLSRIPPFMKVPQALTKQPEKLGSLLSQVGPIGRIYLVPEDAKVTARRKKCTFN